jgi:hypothetical protein
MEIGIGHCRNDADIMEAEVQCHFVHFVTLKLMHKIHADSVPTSQRPIRKILLLLFTSIVFSHGGSSPYTSPDKINKNIYIHVHK